MSVRKRSGSGGRKALKEKVVEVYEGLFRGDQIAVGNSNYWEEFFLLKPKIAVLEVSIIFQSGNLKFISYKSGGDRQAAG